MNKRITLKRVRNFVLILLTLILLRQCYEFIRDTAVCGGHVMYEDSAKYLWLFDTSIRAAITCEYPIGNNTAKRFRYLYTYNNQYRYLIIEENRFNHLSPFDLKDTTAKIDSTKEYMEAFQSYSLRYGGHLYVQTKLCMDSTQRLSLCFDSDGKVFKSKDLYKVGYSGAFKKVLLQNEKKESVYLLKYDRPTKTTIFFYKPHATLYLIVFNAFEGETNYYGGIDFLNAK